MSPKYWLIFISIMTWNCLPAMAQSQVAETKHNLSVSGVGQYKSVDETEICKFCHTPHTANPKQPLWNHELSAVVNYQTYQSPSFDASLSEGRTFKPDGTSKLCLSCHDGTVAIGAIGRRRQGRLPTGKLGTLPPSAKGFIGTDLSGSHPISFIVSEELIASNNAKDTPLKSLMMMKTDRNVKLDSENKVQCTTCHDAHSDANFSASEIHFWRKGTFSEVCSVCHIF